MRVLSALFVLLALPPAAAAQGWIEPIPLPRPVGPPQQVEKLRTSVIVRVVDRVARVEVEEVFRNNGRALAEGDYIYPLAGEAVFSEFSLVQGEEELTGEAMDATRARAIYEEIVRRHRDPALIEMAGHGLLRARVFPIGPGDTRSIRLRYSQVLERSGDGLRFRYVAGTARPLGAAAPGAQPRGGRDGAPLTFTLVADEGGRFAEPFSPTHRLQVSRTGERLTVRPAGELTGNVDLFLPLAGDGVGITLATHRVDGEDGYFMLTLSPGAVEAAAAPRDVAVVVDVSGSMSGDKLEQARQALHQLLGTLGARDRFRLVAFSNRVEAHAPQWSDTTAAAIEDAHQWVDRLAASGGTNIAGALDEAFRTPAGPERLHLVIFITDGQPTVGETNPDRIAAQVEAARGDARIFTFGVGYDLQTYLLERMAAAGRGTIDYVEPNASVEEAVSALAARIRHPVLVDLAFAGSPVRLVEMEPSRLPDLFAGQDLVVFGRYEAPAGRAAGDLSIRGTRNGRIERFAARVEFPAHERSGEYIPSLWAARKVGDLMRTIRVEGSTPERVEEVRTLALRHGLVTEYTSYLVQEPGQFRQIGGGLAPLAAPAAARPPAAAEARGGRGGGGGGRVDVQTARAEGQLRAANSVAEASAAGRVLVDGLEVGAPTGTRLVAGRTFRFEGGAWIDANHSPQAAVLEIEPFSRAYFDLLAKLSEIAPYWQAFETVTVAGRHVSIRLAAGGRSTMTPAELEKLARDFRAP